MTEPAAPAAGEPEIPGLSGALELLWAPPDRGRRGPKPALSLDRIVAMAVAIADRDGLSAVSMSNLAAELGFTTMSLYRYVASKDDLIQLMLNHAAGRPPDHPEARGWREALERWNIDQIDVLMRHPWRTQIPISGPPLTPNELLWFDRALGALADTPLTAQERFAVVQSLATIGLGQVRVVMEIRDARARGHGDPMPFQMMLAQLVTPESHPAIHEALHSGDLDDDGGPPDPGEDPDFLFAVDRLLDGVEAYIARRSTDGSGTADSARGQ